MIEASTQTTTPPTPYPLTQTPNTTVMQSTRIVSHTRSHGMGRPSFPQVLCTRDPLCRESNNAQVIIQGLSELVSKIADLVTSIIKMREADKNSTADGTTTPNPATSGETGESTSSGTTETATQSNSIALGSTLQGGGEFLWKPKSDKDGKLAVLLPSSLTGSIKEVAIVSPNGKRVLQKGRYSGVGNGERTHFRFSKAGGSFPDGAIVLVKLNDGTMRHTVIKETSRRVTR